jgi:hypothetical protein
MRLRLGEFLIALGVVGVAVILSQALFAPPIPSGGRALRTPSPSVIAPSVATPSVATPSVATPSVATPSDQTARHTNAAAGYSFRRPAGWVVSESGTVSELTGPDRDVTVSFGLGSDGGLARSALELTTSIQGAYEDVRVDDPQRETIAGRPAILVGGRAVNDAGVRVRFLAISLRIEDQNYAIAVFVSDASDPVTVLPAVEDVVSSFDAA